MRARAPRVPARGTRGEVGWWVCDLVSRSAATWPGSSRSSSMIMFGSGAIEPMPRTRGGGCTDPCTQRRSGSRGGRQRRRRRSRRALLRDVRWPRPLGARLDEEHARARRRRASVSTRAAAAAAELALLRAPPSRQTCGASRPRRRARARRPPRRRRRAPRRWWWDRGLRRHRLVEQREVGVLRLGRRRLGGALLLGRLLLAAFDDAGAGAGAAGVGAAPRTPPLPVPLAVLFLAESSRRPKNVARRRGRPLVVALVVGLGRRCYCVVASAAEDAARHFCEDRDAAASVKRRCTRAHTRARGSRA